MKAAPSTSEGNAAGNLFPSTKDKSLVNEMPCSKIYKSGQLGASKWTRRDVSAMKMGFVLTLVILVQVLH